MNLKSANTARVGKSFIKARLARSLSQSDVAAATLININYIHAIESGDYSIFPARMFALKYFEKYANFLVINVKFFDIYSAKVVAQSDRKEISQSSSSNFYSSKSLIILIFIFLLIISIIFLLSFDKRSLINVDEEEIDVKDISMNTKSIQSYKIEVNDLHSKVNNFLNNAKLNSDLRRIGIELEELENE